MAARRRPRAAAPPPLLLLLLLLLRTDSGVRAISTEDRAVCATAGARALDRHPSNRKKAVVTTKSCEQVAIDTSANATELDASGKSLDVVVDFPDVASLNLANNHLESFPAVDHAVPLRSLNLSQNRFLSLADVYVPRSLKSLDVSSCQLLSIETNGLPSTLERLRLGGNLLRVIAGVEFPASLKELYLNDQSLGQMDDAVFPPALETLSLANTNLSAVRVGSGAILRSLSTLDVSSNRIQSLPPLRSFSALANLNASFNDITAVAGIRFPPTLKQLDLRGNPLAELEVARSDLELFRSWVPLLPALEQARCRHASAQKVLVTQGVELCVLNDADFEKIYGGATSTTSSPSGDSGGANASTPATIDSSSSRRSALSWSSLIIAVLAVSTVVTGIIALLSWRRQKLRKRLRTVQQTRMSLCDTILTVMGFDERMFALRVESDDIRVLRVLGKAGCGMVYLAELTRCQSQRRRSSATFASAAALQWDSAETSGSQLVTLKRILPELAVVNSPSLTLFLLEIQLMARLAHPRLIALLGVTWTSISDVAMVLEFLPNGDLGALLQSEREREKSSQSRRLHWFDPTTSFAATLSLSTQTLPSKAAIALDILEALAFLHSFTSPVVHHELRAQNVLLNANFDAKLSNVGTQSEWQLDALRPESDDSIAWTAPEILRGEAVDERADMYSFGVLLTEMASNARPFAGLLAAEIIFRVLATNTRPDVDSSCPEGIRALAMRCMHNEPARRPSAMDAYHELETMLCCGSRLSAL